MNKKTKRMLDKPVALSMPVQHVRPNDWDGHRVADKEMVDNVAEVGILQPLICRWLPDATGAHDKQNVEVVAGSRRRDAALKAHLAEVPVLVYTMTTAVARMVNLAENFHRADKPAVAEGEQLAQLIKDKVPLETIVAMTGKSRRFILRRAQLATLNVSWLRIAKEQCLPAGHLELIARYPKTKQADLFDELAGREGSLDIYFRSAHSYTELLRKLSVDERLLKDAQWKLDDALLVPEAGACLACPKRTSAAPELWDDVLPDRRGKPGDRCLDGECWLSKVSAVNKARAAAEKAKAPKKSLTQSRKGKAEGAEEEQEDTEQAKGKEAGKPVLSLDQRRAQLECRRTAAIIQEKLLPALDNAKLPNPDGDVLTIANNVWWLRLVAAWGLAAPAEIFPEQEQGWASFDALERVDAAEIHKELWALLKPRLAASVAFKTQDQLAGPVRGAAIRLAGLLGLKWVELLSWSTEKIREPAGWAKEEAEKN